MALAARAIPTLNLTDALLGFSTFDCHAGLLDILPLFVAKYLVGKAPGLAHLNHIPGIVGIGFFIFLLFYTPRLNRFWWLLVVLVAPAAYFHDAISHPRPLKLHSQPGASIATMEGSESPLLIWTYYALYLVANFALEILLWIPSFFIPFYYWFTNCVLMLDVYLFYPNGFRIGLILQSLLSRIGLDLNVFINMDGFIRSQWQNMAPFLWSNMKGLMDKLSFLTPSSPSSTATTFHPSPLSTSPLSPVPLHGEKQHDQLSTLEKQQGQASALLPPHGSQQRQSHLPPVSSLPGQTGRLTAAQRQNLDGQRSEAQLTGLHSSVI